MFQSKPKFGPKFFEAGTVIIQQGEIPELFYIIVKGNVEVVAQPPNDLEEVLAILGPSDYFGEVGMMTGSLRSATVRSLTDVNVMAMDSETFRHWVDSSPMIEDEINSLVAQRLPADGALELIHTDFSLEMIVDNPDTAVKYAERYAPEEYILKQGDKADKFYIIIDGFVTVTHVAEDGEEYMLAHLTSGDYFGEIGLLDARERIASVRALTAVRVVSFGRDTFRQWMTKSPESRDEIEETARRRLHDTGMLSLSDDHL